MAFLGVGSNLSEIQARNEILKAAVAMGRYGALRASDSYLTAGVGEKSVGLTYCNAVFELATELSAGELACVLKEYEVLRGRRHGERQVVIDLDLVVFNGDVLRPLDFVRSYFSRGYEALLAVEDDVSNL